MQPVGNLQHQFFLSTGFYFAGSALYSIYKNGASISALAWAIDKCSAAGVLASHGGNFSCRVKIAELFGPGVAIWHIDLMKKTFNETKNILIGQIFMHAMIGILGTAIAVGTIAKIKADASHNTIPEASSSPQKRSAYNMYMAGLMTGLGIGSFLISVWELKEISNQLGKSVSAINSCCNEVLYNFSSTWVPYDKAYGYTPSAGCSMDITKLFGPGAEVSSIPDLCASTLPQLYENTRSTIISNSLWIAMLTAIPLGFLAKYGYDYYKSRQSKLNDEFARPLSPTEMEHINDEMAFDSDEFVLSSSDSLTS